MNKILIIDDEPPIRKMLKKRLERNSYQVWEADNGRQGLELYREHDPNENNHKKQWKNRKKFARYIRFGAEAPPII